MRLPRPDPVPCERAPELERHRRPRRAYPRPAACWGRRSPPEQMRRVPGCRPLPRLTEQPREVLPGNTVCRQSKAHPASRRCCVCEPSWSVGSKMGAVAWGVVDRVFDGKTFLHPNPSRRGLVDRHRDLDCAHVAQLAQPRGLWCARYFGMRLARR